MESAQEQMGRARMEQQKLAGEKAYFATQNESAMPGIQTGQMAMTGCDKPVQEHPREILLRDINDAEQRLLDKLATLRSLRLEFNGLSRYEAEKILNINRLADRLRD